MDKPRQVDWDAAIRILTYIKKSPGRCVLFKKNDVSRLMVVTQMLIMLVLKLTDTLRLDIALIWMEI